MQTTQEKQGDAATMRSGFVNRRSRDRSPQVALKNPPEKPADSFALSISGGVPECAQKCLTGTEQGGELRRELRRKRGRPREYDFTSADWTLPNKTIAALIGCARGTVASERSRMNHPRPVMPRRGPVSRIDWAGQDWTLTDGEIGRRVGRNRTTVLYWRHKLGMEPRARRGVAMAGGSI
jgi:hypothetical protein